jgi:hypothetical protein
MDVAKKRKSSDEVQLPEEQKRVKYVAPHARKEGDENAILKRTIRGLLNKISSSNLESIGGEIFEMFSSGSRRGEFCDILIRFSSKCILTYIPVLTALICDTIISNCVENIQTSSFQALTLHSVNAALIAMLNSLPNVEIGLHANSASNNLTRTTLCGANFYQI